VRARAGARSCSPARDWAVTEYSTATVVQGNRGPAKARGRELLGTSLAVCNTKAYASPKHSKKDKGCSGGLT
jgi:hypothetical protein